MAESYTSSSTWTGPVRPPSPTAITVAVRTLGCKVNRVDSERIAASLLGSDVLIGAEDEASVIVVNTCAVTGEAEAKARKAARHAANLPHAPAVVVTGCVSAIAAAELEALHERIVVENDKSRVAGRVLSLLGRDALPQAEGAPVRVGEPFRTRAVVKIEDGCDAFCAYCIVPIARGLPRSEPLRDVIAEVQALADAGVSEVVVTGINIGRYDDSGADLPALLEAIAATGVSRIRLSSIEPLDLTDRLLSVLASGPQWSPHLHVPLQSGSDAVLREMGRVYSVAQFEQRIAAAREALPGLAVTTDVIAGFPGETIQWAEETLATCERIGFSRLHVFRYSRRSGTRAATLEQLPAKTVAARAAALRDLDDRLRGAHRERRAGQSADVLVESCEGGVCEGTTEDYLHVRIYSAEPVPAPESPGSPPPAVGDIVRVRLELDGAGELLGRL